MTTEIDTAANAALKARHRTMWALGDYPAVATEVIAALGDVIVDACGIAPGDRVLDVAAGSGNAAIPAALRGAAVVASDLTPELFEAGRKLAALHGATVEWEEGDAEALPYGEGEFDVVMSTVGVMFAPNHQASADELIRVTRPGGTIGLISWTPEGFIGQMFAVMKPYAPPPAPGAQPPPLWGRPTHVQQLLGDRVDEFDVRRQRLRVNRFESPAEFRDFFKRCYGPTIATYRNIAGDPVRVADLDRELAELARQHGYDDGGFVMEWEYLLVTARRSEKG
ncbi:MAG TPA: class I SAM-dependent methyltransferase [Jiangellaceae bacterium]